MSVACSLKGFYWARADLLALLYVVFLVFSINNILITSIQLQVYNSMINREKINRI